MIEEGKNIYVSITKDDTIDYPIHSHGHWEIMCYVSGEGVMKTKNGNIPFSTGTVICIPPFLSHGSSAKNGFKNISLGCDGLNFNSNTPIVLDGNQGRELSELVKTIYSLYYRDGERYYPVIEKLIDAINFILPPLTSDNDLVYQGSVVEHIKTEIVNGFTDCYFSLAEIIKELPYTDDYVRTLFKAATGKTPLRYLTDVRLSHADNLLQRNPNEKISRVALASGFSDPLYFSRAYKKKYGFSPLERKEHLKK